MKKTSPSRRLNPTAASLREMPEVVVSAYRVRRNPYAERIAREGRQLVHDGPSAASLQEIPEVDFTIARVRRNPYASRAAELVGMLQYGRGRPRRDAEVGPTEVRSVRLPGPVWKALETAARQRQTTVHALLREVIGAYVETLEAPRKKP